MVIRASAIPNLSFKTLASGAKQLVVHEALETIKLIVGINNNLIGKLLMYDGMNHKTEVIEL